MANIPKTPDYAVRLTKLICEKAAPHWLPDRLRFFADALAGAKQYASRRQPREQVSRELREVEIMAKALGKLLRSHDIVYALTTVGYDIREIPGLNLKHLHTHASKAIEKLVVQKGRASSQLKPKALSTRAQCALIINEVWYMAHGNYPLPGDDKAWKAASLLWRMAKFPPLSNDPFSSAWKRHFETIRKRSKHIEQGQPDYDSEFAGHKSTIKSHLKLLGPFKSIEEASLFYGLDRSL